MYDFWPVPVLVAVTVALHRYQIFFSHSAECSLFHANLEALSLQN
jgi:hypothetical protein